MTRIERIGAHSHIRGLGLDDALEARYAGVVWCVVCVHIECFAGMWGQRMCDGVAGWFLRAWWGNAMRAGKAQPRLFYASFTSTSASTNTQLQTLQQLPPTAQSHTQPHCCYSAAGIIMKLINAGTAPSLSTRFSCIPQQLP